MSLSILLNPKPISSPLLARTKRISMHIANFTNTYLPVISGVVRSVRSFRDELTRRGHNVFIFAPESDYTDEEPFIFRFQACLCQSAFTSQLQFPFHLL